MLQFKKFHLLLLAAVLLPAASLLAQSASPSQMEKGVAMKTRDGVTLRADIYRPVGEGPFPVLLQRTPYNKDNAAAFAAMATARGFMVVVQDVRGRYTSEGEWYTFKHETEDGYDTIEWAAALPGSNGKVGMFGGSYVGATQMLAAIGNPPHLAGICPVVTASNYHENWTYQGGAFEQWFDQSWTTGLAQDTFDRQIREASNARIGERTLPLSGYPLFNLTLAPGSAAMSEKLAPYYLDWLKHPQYDGYWKQWSIEEDYSRIQVPALTIAAWYDIFLGGSLRNYVGLRDHAGNAAARSAQRLLVTIGGHAGGGRKVGEVDFGPDADQYDENRLTLEWYEYLFLGKQNRWADAAHPARLFVMGQNQWRDEAEWPLQRALPARYYLHSGGRANAATGDGSLSATAPKAEKPDSFLDDPANPVPTVGGPLCCDWEHLRPGPFDQREVESRPDVLVYTGEPLDVDLEVTGPVNVELWARSTAVDADLTAKLVDVGPDGRAINIAEGILRGSYRGSTTAAPKPLTPGQPTKLTIDLWATSQVFLKGHRIRVEIAGSNFPRFDRNLHTGKTAAESAAFVKATTTVLHDAAHPSALVLPVVR
ncbi:MAG: CocE/NonD family hydrolase [Terracidiphilus sp.]